MADDDKPEKVIEYGPALAEESSQAPMILIGIAFILTWATIVAGGGYLYQRQNTQPVGQTNDPLLKKQIQELQQAYGNVDQMVRRLQTLEKHMQQLSGTKGGNLLEDLEKRLSQWEEERDLQDDQVALNMMAPLLLKSLFNVRYRWSTGESYTADIEVMERLVGQWVNEEDVLHDNLATLRERLASLTVTVSQLHDVFAKLRLQLYRASQPESDTFWERVKGKFSEVVTIRKIDGEDMDAIEAVLQTIQTLLATGKIEEALGMVAELPQPAQELLKDWQASAQDIVVVEHMFEALYSRIADQLPVKNIQAEE